MRLANYRFYSIKGSFKYLEGRSMIRSRWEQSRNKVQGQLQQAGKHIMFVLMELFGKLGHHVQQNQLELQHLFGCVVEAQYDIHSLIHRAGSRDTCGTTTGVVATDNTEATSSSAATAAIGEIVT